MLECHCALRWRVRALTINFTAIFFIKVVNCPTRAGTNGVHALRDDLWACVKLGGDQGGCLESVWACVVLVWEEHFTKTNRRASGSQYVYWAGCGVFEQSYSTYLGSV